MTTCREFTTQWSEWHAGALDNTTSQLLWRHAQDCPHCAAYHRQMQSMLKALNSLPAPGPMPDGLTERLLAEARAGEPQRKPRAATRRYMGAAAAVFVMIVGAALLSDVESPVPSHTPEVVVGLDRARNVHVVFEAEARVDEVEYVIELPPGVEVEGYPGQKVLRWTGNLQAGRNGLTLPLIGKDADANGVLKARIRYQDAQRELQIPVKTSSSGQDKRADTRSGAGFPIASMNQRTSRGLTA